MDPPLRETMLARGEVDAITGFTFTSLLNLEARGVKLEDVVTLPYPQYGVKLYGNVIIASPKLIRENPQAIKAFLAAFAKGAKEAMANPDAAAETIKARDGIANIDMEKRRFNGDQRRDRQPRRPRRGLRPGRSAPLADGLAGVRCLQHQDPRQPGHRLERLLPAFEGGAERAAARAQVTGQAGCAAAGGDFIRFSDVWLAYNEELGQAGQFAVEAIDLQVRQGEFIAIVGPSGCGKSTFMKLATGLRPPRAAAW